MKPFVYPGDREDMNTYTELKVDGYERVVRCDNSEVGFASWIAIHDTTLGPALGGCRVWSYESEENALIDVLRLSKGMTYKNALAHLPLGGGKSVIRTHLADVDRPAMFTSFGKFVEYIGGKYITAEDVNSTLEDMETVKRETSHVATVGASGNPSPLTAYGVYCGIKACVRHRLKIGNLAGLTVALQGVGETGGRLATLLANDGCKLVVADINEKNINKLAQEISFQRVDVDMILQEPSDIFSPCALGGILNDATIPLLQTGIVAGSANNQLLREEHGTLLQQQGILYAPDFAINAGGVINISCEIGQKYSQAKAKRRTESIEDCLLEIFRLAEVEGVSTNSIAIKMAEEAITQKRSNPESPIS